MNVLDLDFCAVYIDLSAVRMVYAGEDFHKGRFPSAVFPEEAVDLAGPYFHGNIVQSADAGEVLANVPEFNDRRSISDSIHRNSPLYAGIGPRPNKQAWNHMPALVSPSTLR